MPLFPSDPTFAVLQSLPGVRRRRNWMPPGTSGPATVTDFLTDNFTGTDGTNLTAHTSDSGASWATLPSSGGAFAIQTNKAYATAGGAMYASAVPPTADYSVKGQLTILSAVHNTSYGVIGRADSASFTCYMGFIYCWSGVFSLFLSLFNGGSYGNFANVGLGSQPTVGTNHEVRLDMIGNQISVYYDGSQLITPVTDATITTKGFAGLYSGASTTTTGCPTDSITATPL